MTTDVEAITIPLDGSRNSADDVIGFDDRADVAMARQLIRRCQSRRPGADYDNLFVGHYKSLNIRACNSSQRRRCERSKDGSDVAYDQSLRRRVCLDDGRNIAEQNDEWMKLS
jgi:hypothetical protein